MRGLHLGSYMFYFYFSLCICLYVSTAIFDDGGFVVSFEPMKCEASNFILFYNYPSYL